MAGLTSISARVTARARQLIAQFPPDIAKFLQNEVGIQLSAVELKVHVAEAGLSLSFGHPRWSLVAGRVAEKEPSLLPVAYTPSIGIYGSSREGLRQMSR